MELSSVNIVDVDAEVTASADPAQFRVGVAALLHESNTFVDKVVHRDDFVDDLCVSGAELITTFRDAPHEVGGFIEGLEGESIAIVPLLAARLR